MVATAFRWMGLEGPEPALGEESIAAIAKVTKFSDLGLSGSDGFPELRLSQLASQQVMRASEGVRLAQCYCDNCWRLCPDCIEVPKNRFCAVQWS